MLAKYCTAIGLPDSYEVQLESWDAGQRSHLIEIGKRGTAEHPLPPG